MRQRAWLLPLALVIIIAALVLLTPNKPSRSPDHRSESDAFDGTSALFAYASRLGHPTSAVKGSFNLPDSRGLLFVFSPAAEFTDDQAAGLARWLSGGGVLVYAAAQGDSRLDTLLEVQRDSGLNGSGGPDLNATSQVRLVAATPLLVGVHTVLGSDLSVAGVDPPSSLAPMPAQVSLLRGDDRDHQVAAFFEQRGRGRVVVLSDPQVLGNGNLGQAQNGRLAADLISLAPEGAPVLFDEFHHGAGGTTPSIVDWVTTPWGAVLGWALAIAYFGLLLRGSAFGPQLSLAPRRERSTAEYAQAVGTLLRRAGARATTLTVLGEATRRSLAERVGLGHGLPPEQLGRVLERRAPDLARALSAADTAAAAGGQSERGLLEAARRFHRLAYPSAEKK
jgi:hypothetical protein